MISAKYGKFGETENQVVGRYDSQRPTLDARLASVQHTQMELVVGRYDTQRPTLDARQASVQHTQMETCQF